MGSGPVHLTPLVSDRRRNRRGSTGHVAGCNPYLTDEQLVSEALAWALGEGDTATVDGAEHLGEVILWRPLARG